MRKNAFARLAVAALLAMAATGAGSKGSSPDRGEGHGTGTESGFALFQQHCMSCHGNPDVPRAPSPETIRGMTPEHIFSALTDGVMQGQGASLSDGQRRMIAAFMSARPLGSLAAGDAEDMPNKCAAHPLDMSRAPGWNGWGNGLSNARYQSAAGAGLGAADMSRLKLKWAFGYPGGLSAYGQPTLAGGRVFVGTDIGYIYSLDQKTGCVYWSYQTKAAVRNAITLGPVSGQGATKLALFFGDFRANVYALDAEDGHLLWMKKVDDHLVARITAAPALYDGKLFVPVSSSEEFNAAVLDYPCCTARGSIVALDSSTGNELWKAYTVPTPVPTRKNSKGVQLYAPSGGSVWNTPTVDPKRGAVYFGTGDAETEPAPATTDAVMALDMASGKPLWSYQMTAGDSFLGGCSGKHKTDNCPSVVGPDLDIGNSPILRELAGGKRMLIAGTKDGSVVGLDPDRGGALVWRTNAAPPPAKAAPRRAINGIFFGGAADDRNVYYGLSGGGIAALDIATGRKVWYTAFAKPEAKVGNQAAASAIPGVVFVGGTDGVLHAVSATSGKPLWQFATARAFDTVNKVPAHGGGMMAPGATIAGGMMFVGSGYAVIGDKNGNVLLAFAPE